MTHTLLLRLAGPLQAWGTQSRFSIRDTGQEPSKSGVIGLLCAALGAPRDDTATVHRLAALRFGVRVEREGVMKKDFHTAQNVAIASGGRPKSTEISDRWYLADAEFLAALEGEDVGWLHTLQAALQAPRWQLSLGRKAFVPTAPVWLRDGVLAASLDDTLRHGQLWQTTRGWRKPETAPDTLRLVTDATPETATEVRQDVPLSFAERRFAVRYVRTEFIAPPVGQDAILSHDSEGGA